MFPTMAGLDGEIARLKRNDTETAAELWTRAEREGRRDLLKVLTLLQDDPAVLLARVRPSSDRR